ncbi:hypothetical protein D1B31_02305 [Neobacillus notoginsengisoli]|uniref:Uncharacterized protein n=1 Tax=Neobacillus notoginsengisoli TaxID=1578198 RepID=A0A417Z0Y3_9BACI|nr:DUF6155 family protein [Neobacillus notoginsengisoli]RHW43511.1 hypothetical protein D1B31_02305 [Neobacillus notoginsengisoli]
MKIKVSELKKELKEYDQKELIQLITELFKTSKDVQSILSVKFLGDKATEELYSQAKKSIENEFFPDRGEPKLRLANAKKTISNFGKLTGHELKTLDLMLFYVEQGVKFTNAYGNMYDSFYNSLAMMYDKVTSKCGMEEEYYNHFAERLENVLENTVDMDWGFYEELAESYYNTGYPNEDDE